tara:strand:- start:1169 stop:1336 length:168 start_codon:yes stop_codon:yes gene_type:complete
MRRKLSINSDEFSLYTRLNRNKFDTQQGLFERPKIEALNNPKFDTDGACMSASSL